MQTILRRRRRGFVHPSIGDELRHPLLEHRRSRYFGQNRPASTLVQVSALANPDYKIEIEAIAVAP